MPLYFNGPRASGKTHWCFENAKMVNGVVYLGYGTSSVKSYFAEIYNFPEEDIYLYKELKDGRILPLNRPVFVDEGTAALAKFLGIPHSFLYGISDGPDTSFLEMKFDGKVCQLTRPVHL